MKKILLLLFCFPVFSQDYLEEVTKVFDNGKPMFVDYLDIEDLKKVKTDMFNENGDRVFSISFNKESGLPDGEFFDLINKGYFENGVLNCDNCMLVESNTPSVFSYNYDKQNTFITKGSVVNGRFIGEVEKYGYFESTYRRVDWESTRRYIQAGVNRGFRDVVTIRTGNFNKTPSEFIFYNQNGQIEGNYIKNIGEYKIEFDVKDDIIQTYVVKDGNGLVVDSLSNENKIWKINYKFKKNNGLIVFNNFSNISGPNNFDSTNPDYTIAPYNGEENAIVIVGGYVSVNPETSESSSVLLTGGKPSILDSNGLFSIYRSEKKKSDYIKYDDTLEVLNYNIGQTYDMYDTNTIKGENIFFLIYNYLMSGNQSYLQKEFVYFPWSESGQSIVEFINRLNNSKYLKKYLDLSDYLYETYSDGTIDIRFSVYDKRITQKNGYEEEIHYLKLSKLLKEVISIKDYLTGIFEYILSSSSELEKLYVWNEQLKTYDLIDFEELIKIAEEKETTTNSNDYFDDSDYIVWFTSDKNGEGEYTNEFDGYLENFVKMEQLGFSSDSENLNNYYRLYFEDVESLESYGVSGNWKLIGKDKIRLFTIISQPNPNNPNNQNDSSFNEDDYELKYTSDKNENKKKYKKNNFLLKYTRGLNKIHGLVNKNDKKGIYTKYFFDDTKSLEDYSIHLSNSDELTIVNKDLSELTIIFKTEITY